MGGIYTILFLIGIFFQALPYGLSDLTFSPQELYVHIGGSQQFTLTLDKASTKNSTVEIVVTYPEIAKTDFTQLEITANRTFEQEITVFGLEAGNTIVSANLTPASTVNTDNAYVQVTVYHSSALLVISDVVGWIYFVAWSVSFYPQCIENWRRKSVVGLNFDFLALNLLGFFLYSLFNCGLYWIPIVRDEYLQKHEKSSIPVKLNDVFFSVHAVLITLVTIIQCFIYERGGQRVSIIARALMGVFFLFLFISLICTVCNVLQWLDFLYYCSYVKLTITLIKYIPQAFMNYQRKSTIGWSIGNVLLDFTGGVFSMLQMILDSYNCNEWSSIFGDPTKFGLGLFSVVFDILFIVQHYILYRNRQPHQDLSGYETINGVDSAEEESSVVNRSQSTSSKNATSREFVT